MSVQKLTENMVAELSCPQGRRHFEVFDTLMRGLYVDVLDNGRMSYRVRYRMAGRSRVQTLGDARVLTLKEAREAARLVLRQVLAGLDPRQQVIGGGFAGPSVQDFFMQKYLPFVKGYKRSWYMDASILRTHILPVLGGLAMGAVTPPDIAAVISSMRSRGYAPSTCNRILILLRYGYTLALRWQVEGVTGNPARELKNFQEDNRIERYLTGDQAEALLRAVRGSQNPLLAPVVSFLVMTGARKREALDARWEDIDWEQRQWRIPRSKSGKVRYVPLSAGALQVLGMLHDQRGKSDHVFVNPATGRPFVSLFCSWNRARCEAGLPDLRMHDLRHSFASFLVNAGRSLYEVQELLGHADIRTTSRYAHLSRERLFEAVEAVPWVLGGCRGG